jgi:hypothetical protein
MANAPAPVTIVGVTPAAGAPAPKPLGLVGGLPAASSSVVGGVKKGAAVANATDAASALTQLNALLTSLRAAGVIS